MLNKYLFAVTQGEHVVDVELFAETELKASAELVRNLLADETIYSYFVLISEVSQDEEEEAPKPLAIDNPEPAIHALEEQARKLRFSIKNIDLELLANRSKYGISETYREKLIKSHAVHNIALESMEQSIAMLKVLTQ